jgi:hypothetical protein
MIDYRKFFGWGSQNLNGKAFVEMIQTIFKTKQNKSDLQLDILNIPTFTGRVLSILINETGNFVHGEARLNIMSADPFLYPGKSDVEKKSALLFDTLDNLDKLEYPFLKNVKIEKADSIEDLQSKKYDAIIISRIDIKVTDQVLKIIDNVAKDGALISIDFTPIEDQYLKNENHELELINQFNNREDGEIRSIFVYQLTRRIKPTTKNHKNEMKEVVNVLSQNNNKEK